jgi:hypothetical protein
MSLGKMSKIEEVAVGSVEYRVECAWGLLLDLSTATSAA